jgi:hypothetical protein
MRLIPRWFGRKRPGPTGRNLPEIVRDGGDIRAFGGCGHPGPRSNLKIQVFGHEVTVKQSPLCASCTEKRIVECSTHCAGCDFPILPGMRVAAAWVGAPHPLTHMSEECGDPHFYDGIWGAGVQIGLAELHPGCIPDPLNDLLIRKQ